MDQFDSGQELLDSWLGRHALRAQVTRTARTYVWLDEADVVVAYYSLVPHTIRRDDLPSSLGHGSPDLIPAILLARLALVQSLQSRGAGTALLVDALVTALSAIRVAGGRLIVVDAVDDHAEAFYVHHGFVATPTPGRLVMKATDAAETLGLVL